MGNEVRIPRSEIERLVGNANGRLIILYATVSGQGQRRDLETQLARLQAWAATERKGNHTLALSNSGFGLSATRRRPQRLLKLVRKEQSAEVVMTYPDRPTRFGQTIWLRSWRRFPVGCKA